MIFIDIDGTLTDSPESGGKPLVDRIEKLKLLIHKGQEVVLWTGNGTAYAKKFAQDNGIVGAVCVSKPHILVDDNPNIRPLGRIKVLDPATFFGSI
jgi:hydroxymethylpyrimidine pyrophosphatase-like HAD family hydrolase